jgi:hypothetical protein
MTKTKALMDLTPAAQSALLAAQNRIGAVVTAPLPVLSELSLAGLTSVGNGLTGRGWIERGRIFDARIEASF